MFVKTEVPGLPDYQVIEHSDLNCASCFDDAASQAFVFL
jgi:hypothetical protein